MYKLNIIATYIDMYSYIIICSFPVVTDSLGIQSIMATYSYTKTKAIVFFQVQLMEHSNNIQVLEYFLEVLGACSQ